MINIQKFYDDNPSSYSSNPVLWPAEVLLDILNNMPQEGHIYFPEGPFTIETINLSDIVINRPIVISGSGTSGTTLNLQKSFQIQSSHVTFENLAFERSNTFATGALTVTASYFSLRNVSLKNQAAINTSAVYLLGSASNWYMENVELEGFQSGLKNEGNFGTCINTSAFNNTIGIEDDCTEGSTYVACRTHNNSSIGIRSLQRSLFSGCFATDEVEIKSKTLWVGGNLDYKKLSTDTSGSIFTKNAFKQFHDKIDSSHFKKNDNEDDQASFSAGGTTDGILEFPVSSNSAIKWELKFGSSDINNPEEIVYELDHNGTSALSFSAGNPNHNYNTQGQETFMTPGKIGFPEGYYIGRGNGFIHVKSSDSKPSGSGRKGDRVMNRTPIVIPANSGLPPSDNNFLGWICVSSAPNAIWRGFGLLEE